MSGLKAEFEAFDGMTWPTPSPYMDEVGWQLRYGEPTTSQLLWAAWVLDAYAQMIRDPEHKRRRVVRKLREGMKRIAAPNLETDP